MEIYKGTSAFSGIEIGKILYYHRGEYQIRQSMVDNVKKELDRLDNARTAVKNQIQHMYKNGAPLPKEQELTLKRQLKLLSGGSFQRAVESMITTEKVSAAYAVQTTRDELANVFRKLEDEAVKEQIENIREISELLIGAMGGSHARINLGDEPVILAAERLMPTDLFSVPSGMILGIITAEGSGQSHAAIIARAMNIPGIVQVGRDFLDDCDGRTVILDATGGQCTLDPDAAARQQAETRICELQRENEEMGQLHALPSRTKDGQPFELLANCFGPEDIDTAMQSGAQGVGLLRTGYMMLPGRILDEQEQYFFYCSCLAAAKGCPVTVRTFDFGSDRTISDAYQGLQSSKLGLRGIRNSLRQPHQFETQLCALLRAAARGPLRVMFPMVTNVEDWDAAMRVVERCREHLRERGVAFNEDTKFGVMLSVPAACLTAEEFVEHGVDFLVVGTNDLTQYTHAADRELASAEHYYRPASKAMKKLITMVMDAAKVRNVPVTICGLAVGNPANTVQYLQLGLRSFSVSPQNLLNVKKALLEAET